MASYLGNNPDNIIKVRKANYRYVATAAQTVFSGTDSNSLTMAINTADVEVFLNGVLLDQTDYTATISAVTLGAGATVNDIVEVITNTDFQVANLYTKEEVDSKVATAITDLVGTAGSALNTLGELSDALNDDANYAATITTALGTKANSSDVTTALSAKAPLASPTFTGDVAINSTSALKLPSGTTAERPASPTGDMIRKNTTTGYIEYYDISLSSWVGLGAFAANGGTVSYAGGYTYHTFTASSVFTVTAGAKTVEYLVVAGGGGGGRYGGGGGAGGYVSGSMTASANSYIITVGSGGAGHVGDAQGGGNAGSGTSSSISSLVSSVGGGGAGNYGNPTGSPGVSGGSGGGAGISNTSGSLAGGSGTSGQGNAGGGSPGGTNFAGGGGGGASATGANGNSTGRGGNGSTWLNGTTYAGGGSGSQPSSNLPGGNGGGGAGFTAGTSRTSAIDATQNTGGGGGGGRDNSPSAGNGGSGIVIIRYLT
jgi:hypothetical protein